MKLHLCVYRKSAWIFAGKNTLKKPVHYVTEYAICNTGVTVM